MKRGVGRLEIWPLSGLPESVVRVDTSELAGESEKQSAHSSRSGTTNGGLRRGL